MGKKKRGHPGIEDILERPWCYYCERDFDDLKILINHQKAKHYKCERCGRRLHTAGGLSVHLNQVHKENLDLVENALPNRQGTDLEVFGMEGIPDDVLLAHNQRITEEYYKNDAMHRSSSGNPAALNATGGEGPKKPKFESPVDLKKRLAEHKAKKAAEAAAFGSGPNTPIPQAGSPQSMQSHHSRPAAQASPPQSAYAQSYGQPDQYHEQQPQHAYPYGGLPLPGRPGLPPPQHAGSPFQGMHGAPPPQHAATPFPGMPGPSPSQHPGSSFPGMHGAPPPQPGGYAPATYGHPPSQYSQGPPQYSQPPPQYSQPHGYGEPGPGTGYPGPHFIPFGPGQGAPAPPVSEYRGVTHEVKQWPLEPSSPSSPTLREKMLARQKSLPSAPGLPQRPTFNAPQVSRSQLQDMHNGQGAAPGDAQAQPARSAHAYDANALDDIISRAQQSAQPSAAQPPQVAAAPNRSRQATAEPNSKGTPVEAADASAKKSSKKSSRLVYSDLEVSPEEKMASMSRYSFEPPKGNQTTLGPVEAAVTGVVRGSDDVGDVQG